jgi:hypothetical protein
MSSPSSVAATLRPEVRQKSGIEALSKSKPITLLQFFLNHRQFMRSECEERVDKSPKELMTGESHPHWIEMLRFKRFQQA